MAFSPSSSHRLRQAYFLLAFLSPFSFAYTPPATPNLPLSFEFLGPTAEADSTAFYNTQCDSDNFSWYGTDWFCAVGDPTNQVCYVKMAYHSSDVNNCQFYTPPDLPDPNLTPDVLSQGSGDNQKLIEKLELMRIGQFNKMIDDTRYQDSDLALSKQTNSLLASLGRTLSYANDNRSIVDAINTWGSSHMIETKEQFLQNSLYRNKQDAENKAMLQQEIGGIGFKLNLMHDTLNNIQNNGSTGGGGGGDAYYYDELGNINATLNSISNATSNLYGLSGNMAGQASNIIGNLSQAINSSSATEQSLLTAINDSIKALGGGDVGDNSAIVDQLIESNNSLSDITLRMRDIENAIGKSEKSIVDAIGEGGNGSDPDSVLVTGCEAFVCSTDSPQCYIARKEWETRCQSISNDLSASNSIDSAVSSFNDYINNPDSDVKNLDAGTVDIKQFTNHYNSSNGVNLGGSDTCPPPYVIDAKITTFTLDLTPFCDLATVIRFFLIAFASVASGLMIVKYH